MLHRASGATSGTSALGNRSRALEATLLDYVRRKEFNRSAQVEILRTETRLDTMRLIVMPSGTAYDNPLPEQIPGYVEEAMAPHEKQYH